MASNSKRNTNVVSVDDTVIAGVLAVLSKRQNITVWSGTMTELNSAFIKVLGKKGTTVLPKSPGALRIVLNRVINRLRNRKVSVRFGRTPDHMRTRYVEFTR